MELENRASTASSNPEQLPFVSVSDMVGGKSNEMDRLVGSLARMEGFSETLDLAGVWIVRLVGLAETWLVEGSVGFISSFSETLSV